MEINDVVLDTYGYQPMDRDDYDNALRHTRRQRTNNEKNIIMTDR